LVREFGDVDRELMRIPFKTSGRGKTKCAWPDRVSSRAGLDRKYILRPSTKCQLLDVEPGQGLGKRETDESGGFNVKL